MTFLDTLLLGLGLSVAVSAWLMQERLQSTV
jgi:hypothetical protein